MKSCKNSPYCLARLLMITGLSSFISKVKGTVQEESGTFAQTSDASLYDTVDLK